MSRTTAPSIVLGFVPFQCRGCGGVGEVHPTARICPLCQSPILLDVTEVRPELVKENRPGPEEGTPLPQVLVQGKIIPAGAVLSPEGLPVEIRPLLWPDGEGRR